MKTHFVRLFLFLFFVYFKHGKKYKVTRGLSPEGSTVDNPGVKERRDCSPGEIDVMSIRRTTELD